MGNTCNSNSINNVKLDGNHGDFPGNVPCKIFLNIKALENVTRRLGSPGSGTRLRTHI